MSYYNIIAMSYYNIIAMSYYNIIAMSYYNIIIIHTWNKRDLNFKQSRKVNVIKKNLHFFV